MNLETGHTISDTEKYFVYRDLLSGVRDLLYFRSLYILSVSQRGLPECEHSEIAGIGSELTGMDPLTCQLSHIGAAPSNMPCV